MYLGPRHRFMASLRTAIVFTIILLVLLLIHFTTPIPPYPEGGGGPGMGLEVNLGASEEGMGVDQPLEPVEMPDFKASEVKSSEEEKVVTQDVEETENIKEIKNETVKKTEKKSVVTSKKTNKTENNSENVEKKQINQKAMFKKNTSSEGITGKAGDQGNPNGVSGSPLYKGTGNGSGGGTGGGSGTGTGPGTGSGISFDLNGRNPQYLQQPEYNNQNEGTVVVKITVDKEGKVISAVPGVKGSTTLDDYLLEVAKKAALQSKFSRQPNATVQTGTISYHFVLQ
jgi:TonB family protein